MSVKNPFIMTLLDKFQPDWRNGADISKETKQSIQFYVEKYRSFLDELFDKNTIEDIISIRSIEKSAGRLRRELGLVAKSTRKTYPKRATSDKASVPQKKKSELFESMRLLVTIYPYGCEQIIDACMNNTDPVEKILKFHKRFPEKNIIIKEYIQSLKFALYNEIQKKQVKYRLPLINKEIIFKNPNEIPGIISLYGCLYTSKLKSR
jgi:hypothetical protein